MTHLRSLRYSDKILCDISISEGDKVGDVGPPSQVCRAPARWWGAGHHHGLLRAPLGYLRAPLGYLRAPLWCLRALIKHSQSALIEFEPLNDEIFQKFFQIMNPILIF